MGKIIKFNANSTKKNEEEVNKSSKDLSENDNFQSKDTKKVKFEKVSEDKENQPSHIEEKLSKENIPEEVKEFLIKVYKGIEEHVLSVFAVKKVIDIAFIVKTNEKGEVGVLGQLAYNHKRREGEFIATFIAKGHIDKKSDKVVITELAFLEGEPDYYATLEKVLKAKKIYPEIEQNNQEEK